MKAAVLRRDIKAAAKMGRQYPTIPIKLDSITNWVDALNLAGKVYGIYFRDVVSKLP